jgi:Acetyltransferase (GNAT) domain
MRSCSGSYGVSVMGNAFIARTEDAAPVHALWSFLDQQAISFGKDQKTCEGFYNVSRPAPGPVETESLFHQHWWLDAVAGSQRKEVSVIDNGTVVGRLPYFETKVLGTRVLGMPPFTRTLGPWIAALPGKAVTQRQRTMRIISDLIGQLPSHGYFKQLLPPTWDHALPFQFAGYSVGIEHTLEIDCRRDLTELWSEIQNKTRTLIRRTGRLCTPEVTQDPVEFFRLYERNIEREGRTNHYEYDAFLRIYRACRDHDAGMILGLRDHKGALVAGLFVVWSRHRMLLLMQTHDAIEAGAGGIELLIWQAIQTAKDRGQVLDMDGMSNQKAAHRHLYFGGKLRLRFVVSGGSCLIPTMRYVRRSVAWKLGNKQKFL